MRQGSQRRFAADGGIGRHQAEAGDRQALERVYHLALDGGNERWTLVLTPLDPKVGAVIARIRMEGVKDVVRSVEILQADGDRSLMTIEQRAPPQ